MACHGGKRAVLRIFLLNAGIFTWFLISQLFSNMADREALHDLEL